VNKKAFELRGRVESVLVAHTFGSKISTEVEKIQAVRGHGIRGDTHAGTRLADVRELEFRNFGFLKGTEILNLREFSAVSVEELAEVAKVMMLPTAIPRGCLGENLIISGIPHFTQLPTGTMLFFQKDANQKRTTVLIVWKENTPCEWPGKAIQERFPDIKGLERLFPKAAVHKRGIVGPIFASGNICPGDTVVIKVPRQHIYDPTQ
jgi:hypothetical protein